MKARGSYENYNPATEQSDWSNTRSYAISVSYCPHARALTYINDRGKVELPEQRSRAQPETVRGQPTFPRSLMSVNARVV